MKKIQKFLRKRDDGTKKAPLFMTFELGNIKWKLAFSDSKKIAFVTIDSRNLLQLQETIKKAKLYFSSSNDVEIVSCCQASRDGFWLHRYLVRNGIKNIVVDLSDMNINPPTQQAKIDRVDAGKLLRMLMRFYSGDKKALTVVQVGSVKDQVEKKFNRKLKSAEKPDTVHRHRIRGLFLIQQGLKDLSGDKRFGFWAVIILLLIFTGYILLNLKLQNSLRWGLEDIAPQKYDSPSLKAKESFVPGFTDEDKIKKEPLAVEKFDNKKLADKDIHATTQVKINNQKDDFSNKQEVELIPDRKIIVYFKHDSNDLPSHAFKTLDQIVKLSANYPNVEFVVEGYTDSFGKYVYNKKLSKIRADIVKKYLVSHGIAATKIKTFGMGSENPIKSNETLDGRKLNRRVEIKILRKQLEKLDDKR